MIEITVEDLVARAPEFKVFSETDDGPASIELMIEDARLWVNETKWGSKAKLATIYVACHLLKDLNFGNAGANTNIAGPITMERVGDLSRSYANLALASASESDQLFVTTKYGKQFIALRKTLLITPLVT